MAQETVYLKLEKDVEIDSEDVFVKDIGKIYCSDTTIASRCKAIKVAKIREGDEQKKVISVMKVIELMKKECPGIEVENIGEMDTLIEKVNVLTSKNWKQVLKIIFVALVSFFGTAFTIMAFHNDIGIQELFSKIHELIMGEPSNGCTILEVAYSIGLASGIILFFNHIGGRRITKDPTPIEVEMRVYEREVNDALIETADREGKTIDVS
ncbi:MAG: stage V sporulation protein AA [Lachnospiraceae bacterium]|nr:stage V sporulation protein AA [Lachnospiraceae bacterium]